MEVMDFGCWKFQIIISSTNKLIVNTFVLTAAQLLKLQKSMILIQTL